MSELARQTALWLSFLVPVAIIIEMVIFNTLDAVLEKRERQIRVAEYARR